MGHERVEFEQVADGLLKGAMEALSDPPLVEKLRVAGLDLNRKLAPAYPAVEFYRWMVIAARHRYPQLSEAEACREVGRLAVIRGMTSTLLGSAALHAMKMLGVRRSLKRIGSSLKHGNNYIDAKVAELGPTSMEIQLGPLVGPPSYYEGVLEEGSRILGGKEVQVTRVRSEGEHVAWQVDWKE
ncbi:MAG: DUF2378 family protein [Archangium sp.]|nr:DUF2378 family protein [Archangium sp.]